MRYKSLALKFSQHLTGPMPGKTYSHSPPPSSSLDLPMKSIFSMVQMLKKKKKGKKTFFGFENLKKKLKKSHGTAPQG